MIRKNFITVHGFFSGIGKDYADVPTREEYDDFRRRMSYFIDSFNERVSALENNTEKKSPQKEENASKWSGCTLYFKIGYQDNSIIVPVLTSDNKQEFICSPIDLGRANNSEIKAEISKIIHKVNDTLGIPVYIAISNKSVGTLDFINNMYKTVNVADTDYQAILKAAAIIL